jgi:hypothetical protein
LLPRFFLSSVNISVINNKNFERYGPIEGPPCKGFPSSSVLEYDVEPTDFSVDVEEQTNALGLGNTFVKNLISPSLEGTVHQLRVYGCMADSFRI